MAADAFAVDILGKGYHFLGLAESAFEQKAIVYNLEGNCFCHRSLFIHSGLGVRSGDLMYRHVAGSNAIQSLLIKRNCRIFIDINNMTVCDRYLSDHIKYGFLTCP